VGAEAGVESKRPRISLTLLFGADVDGVGEGAEGVDELPNISARRSWLLCAGGAAAAPFVVGDVTRSSPRRLSYAKLDTGIKCEIKAAYVFTRLQ
jgi:hypothetical protein